MCVCIIEIGVDVKLYITCTLVVFFPLTLCQHCACNFTLAQYRPLQFQILHSMIYSSIKEALQ